MKTTTTTLVAAVAWLSLLVALTTNTAMAANCPCGYNDPTTGQLWTDAVLTYFNETDASNDIVMDPSVSPYSAGQQSAGNTGSGTQDWSNVGGQVNAWEEAFGATYRSGVLYNNTALHNTDLEMYVQPAELKDRIVYGAECECRGGSLCYLLGPLIYSGSPLSYSGQSLLADAISSMAPFAPL
jgi:hypothetical protein